MPHQAFTISRLAATASVSVETVRYYQRQELLNEPLRPQGGVRKYDKSHVARLQFIRRSQKMGFSLTEIAQLIEVNANQACEQTQRLTERKLDDVRQRLKELQHLEFELVQRLNACRLVPTGATCPTLNLLEQTMSPIVTRGVSKKTYAEKSDADSGSVETDTRKSLMDRPWQL